MTIDEAITILRDSIADNTLLITLEHDAAIKLGIEALKIVEFTRANNFRMPLGLLPGETEE